MTAASFLPAGLIGFIAVLPVLAMRLMPLGPGTVLVRTGAAPGSAAEAAVRSDALLMSIPASGYAVLSGDASRIRAVAGLAVKWDPLRLCRSRP